jgi:hypothetical protein
LVELHGDRHIYPSSRAFKASKIFQVHTASLVSAPCLYNMDSASTKATNTTTAFCEACPPCNELSGGGERIFLDCRTRPRAALTARRIARDGTPAGGLAHLAPVSLPLRPRSARHSHCSGLEPYSSERTSKSRSFTDWRRESESARSR